HDGSNLRLYLDGQEVSNESRTVESADGGMVFGASKNKTQSFLNGQIDGLRIDNTALSATEIQALRDESLIHVQSGGTGLTSGGIDFLYMRANTATSSIVHQTDANLAHVHTEMDDYYRRNSGDRAFINTFDVTPVLDLTGQTFTSSSQLTAAMNLAAEAAGYDLSNYTRFGYGFGSQNFSLPGGAVGSGGATSGSMLVPDAVLSDLDSGTAAIIHESLHALGLGHANNLEFQDQVFDEDYDISIPLASNGDITQAGIDPYHFLGGEGFAGLDSDIAAYQKYYLGWADANNIEIAPADASGTYRVYEHTNDNTPAGRTIALQLGDEANSNGAIWLTYEPDNPNPELETTGVLATFVDPVRPAVAWALDLTPNSQHPYDPTRPEEDGREARYDLYDAAAVVGEEYAIPGFDYEFKVVATGGTGADAWADIQVTKADVVQVDPYADSYDYDIGMDSSPVASGYERLLLNTAGDINWDGSVTVRDRGGSASDLDRDFVFSSSERTLEHTVQNGLWRVTVTMGDASYAHDNMVVAAEGVVVAADVDSAVGQFETRTFDVAVTDGSLSLTLSDNGGSSDVWVLNSISLERIEHIVDTSQGYYTYDFGPDGSVVVDPLRNFLAPKPLTPNVSNASTLIGSVNSGIIGDDGTLGTGYIMYSSSPTQTRFAGIGSTQAEHLILVRHNGTQWQYADYNPVGGDEWLDFTPEAGDLLLAEVAMQSGDDAVTSLEGQSFTVEGIEAGYASGDLTFIANQWNDIYNRDEMDVDGTSFTRNSDITWSGAVQGVANVPGVVVDSVTIDLGDLGQGIAGPAIHPIGCGRVFKAGVCGIAACHQHG
ncbi:MAG: LamG-like jellyroll fold domain-containing protein, partial [Planctomycetota bacterium]